MFFSPEGDVQRFTVVHAEDKENVKPSCFQLKTYSEPAPPGVPNTLRKIHDRITKYMYGVKFLSFRENGRIMNETGGGENGITHLWDWFRTASLVPLRMSCGVRECAVSEADQNVGIQGSFVFTNYSHSSHRDMCLNRLGFQQLGVNDEPVSSTINKGENIDLLIYQISRAVIHQQLEEATSRCEQLRDTHPGFASFLSLLLFSGSQIINAVKARARSQQYGTLQSAGVAFDVAHRSVENDDAWQSFSPSTRANLRCAMLFLARAVKRMIDSSQDEDINSDKFEQMIEDLALYGEGSIQLRFSLALIWCGDVSRLYSMMWQNCVDTGRMDGLCLVGLGASEKKETADEIFSLVSKFVTSTGDIQTAALIYCHALGFLKNEPRCLEPFFNSYSELLLRWKMVVERGLLHSLMSGGQKDGIISRGAIMSCYYCQTPLVGPIPRQMESRAVTMDFNLETVLTKCPNTRCKKPVPQCSVCLMPVYVVSHKTEEGEVGKLPIGDWLSWCQNCHHGGHMKHLMDWFDKFSMCPVADCDCECGAIAR